MSMQPLLSTTASATVLPISQVTADSSIDALPSRLLLEIFNLVFEGEQVECDPPTCVTCSEAEGSPEPHLVWRVMTNPSSQSLFPYSVANVSRRWRNIITTVPEYWTRLVFFLDSESDLGSPSRQLSWSHDLLLDVNVMRRSYARGERNDLERRRAREVTEALMPHAERCTMLFFEVIYSSSLPCILRDLSLSTFAALEGLVLRSFEDDGLAPYRPGPGTSSRKPVFHFLRPWLLTEPTS